MFSFNEHMLHDLQKVRHQTLLQEAEKQRLIRSALNDALRPAPFYRRALCWLGRRLINLGQGLLRRSDALPDDLSASMFKLAE